MVNIKCTLQQKKIEKYLVFILLTLYLFSCSNEKQKKIGLFPSSIENRNKADDYFLDSLEFEKIIEPAQIDGVLNCKLINSSSITEEISCNLYQCEIIDEAYKMVLISQTKEYLDHIVIVEEEKTGPYEKKGKICFGRNRTTKIKDGKLIVTDKIEIAEDYEADTSFEYIVSSFTIDKEGIFHLEKRYKSEVSSEV